MVNEFYTIKEKEYIAEYDEKKSKFIATLVKVNSEEDIAQKLNEIRKRHRDARHHVFSYRLVNGAERFSDDGEPSGTAGVPILDILRGEKLHNVLLVVTRYFGGVLLGTGGLVRAYSTAAKEAILQSAKVKMRLCNECELEIDYNYHNILLHFLKEKTIPVMKTDFSDKVKLTVVIPVEKSKEILDEISEKTDRTTKIVSSTTDYYE